MINRLPRERVGVQYGHLVMLACAFALSVSWSAFGAGTAALGLCSMIALAVGVAARGYGVFSPITIIFTCSCLYLAAPGIGLLADLSDPLMSPEVYFESAAPLVLAYLFAFLLAYEFSRVRGTPKPTFGAKPPSTQQVRVLAIAAMGGALLYMGSVRHDVGLSAGALSRGEQQLALTTTTHVLGFLAVASAMLGIVVWREGRRSGKTYPRYLLLLLVASIVLFGYANVLVLGDRRIFLSEVAALLSALLLGKRARNAIVLMILPLFVVFSVYSALRGTPVDQWADRYEMINPWTFIDPSHGEFGGWGRIAQDVLSRPFPEVWRLTFFQAPLSVLPSGLFPDRPDASSVWYVKTFYPTTASGGGGWAFSIVIESYMNFWILGPVVLGALFGRIVARFESNLIQRAILVFVMAFSFRSDAVSLIQMTGWTVVFVGLVAAMARIRVAR